MARSGNAKARRKWQITRQLWIGGCGSRPKQQKFATKAVHQSGHLKVGSANRIRHQRSVMGPTYGPSAFGHDGGMKTIPSAVPPTPEEQTPLVQVLIADSGPIQSQLLARALKGRREFEVATVDLDTSAMHGFLQSNHADVVLVAGNHLADLSLLRGCAFLIPRLLPCF